MFASIFQLATGYCFKMPQYRIRYVFSRRLMSMCMFRVCVCVCVRQRRLMSLHFQQHQADRTSSRKFDYQTWHTIIYAHYTCMSRAWGVHIRTLLGLTNILIIHELCMASHYFVHTRWWGREDAGTRGRVLRTVLLCVYIDACACACVWLCGTCVCGTCTPSDRSFSINEPLCEFCFHVPRSTRRAVQLYNVLHLFRSNERIPHRIDDQLLHRYKSIPVESHHVICIVFAITGITSTLD